ncbi:PTS sugar transporter subunit IIC, partial [Klebsiella pneumoniae]
MPKVSGCSPGRNKPFTLRYSFMALQDKLIDALGRFATTFNSYRYIMAIKSAFITLMPVIIVGAFSVLISNMVLDPK